MAHCVLPPPGAPLLFHLLFELRPKSLTVETASLLTSANFSSSCVEELGGGEGMRPLDVERRGASLRNTLDLSVFLACKCRRSLSLFSFPLPSLFFFLPLVSLRPEILTVLSRETVLSEPGDSGGCLPAMKPKLTQLLRAVRRHLFCSFVASRSRLPSVLVPSNVSAPEPDGKLCCPSGCKVDFHREHVDSFQSEILS